jgi:hypothetical protein
MKKLNVHIVGFEADPINGGVSGYNWFPKKEDADKEFTESEKINEPYKTEVYQGEIEVEVPIDYSGTENEREDVTRKVEMFLEENGWEESFA